MGRPPEISSQSSRYRRPSTRVNIRIRISTYWSKQFLSINAPRCRLVNQSIKQSADQSINQSINQTVKSKNLSNFLIQIMCYGLLGGFFCVAIFLRIVVPLLAILKKAFLLAIAASTLILCFSHLRRRHRHLSSVGSRRALRDRSPPPPPLPPRRNRSTTSR